MKTTIFALILTALSWGMMAQNAFVGTYYGVANGDNLVLTLQNSINNSVTGKLKDSQQTYTIDAKTSSNQLTGTAKEATLNLTFTLVGTLNASQLTIDFSLLGQLAMSVVFTKQGATNTHLQVSSTASNKVSNNPFKGKIDRRIVGTWKHEEHYSSGSGSNYGGGSTVSYLSFNEDGTMTDEGRRSMVSGSNYSGDTGKSAAKVVEGVYWYSENSQIYLYVTEGGKNQSVLLGKYYIEGNSMLVTGQNGKKMLYQRY
jgi:hypothetical protein